MKNLSVIACQILILFSLSSYSQTKEVTVTSFTFQKSGSEVILNISGTCFSEGGYPIMIHQVGDCNAEIARIPCDGSFQTALRVPLSYISNESFALSYYEWKGDGSFQKTCLKETVLKLK